jgi:hypothetical protein
METKFFKCIECGHDDIVLSSDYPKPFCGFCLSKDVVEIEPHPVWHNPWLYLSKEYSVKGKKFDSLYLWSGLLIKWPVVIKAEIWSGNVAGTLMGVDLPNSHCYKIFNRAIHQEMVNKGWWKTVPSWTR